MAAEKRIERLKEFLKEELSGILDRELEFPDESLVTITKVEVSPDKYYATAFISVLGADTEKIMEILRKNVYNMQQLLNRRVRMRPVPRISFAIDEGEMEREKIEKSLAKLKRDGGL
ncbi:MAG: 30S ribosome-binding factor RbfA [Candidatus Sungbacteria bacterium]|nr:30S ribosome-binding factor RbfA [Candidatus Sungbacteria bacterium]